MNTDHKSLIQYIKDILNKHGPEAVPPNEHNQFLTPDLIKCLHEILHPNKGYKFSFKDETIIFKISGLGDHQTPISYYIYIICRIILEIKDYSIIFPNINDELKSIETNINKMDKNQIIGVSARIRDKLDSLNKKQRVNLNCIVHCEDIDPPERVKKILNRIGGNPFSNEWTTDILLLAQNTIIDLVTDN